MITLSHPHSFGKPLFSKRGGCVNDEVVNCPDGYKHIGWYDYVVQQFCTVQERLNEPRRLWSRQQPVFIKKR